MTRSGVFNSVHSFTQSAIGPTILGFLAAALIFSIALLATRVDMLAPEGRLEGATSRDGMFLVNNLLFVLLTFTVLVGTVFPLVVEAVRGVRMSVGRPYFDAVAVPIGAALLFLMGVGPALPWGRATPAETRRVLLPPLAGAAMAAVVGLLAGARSPWTVLTLAFGGYTAWVTLSEIGLPLRQRMKAHGEGPLEAFAEANLRRGRRRFGGYIVHSGATLVIVAIAVSSTMGISKEFTLHTGESAGIGAYTLTFLRTESRDEPHRQSLVALVAVSRGGKDIGTMAPRMNQYERQREPVGTPDVRTFPLEDLYLSILNLDADGGTLSLHALVNPMVGWIWGATALMAFGGIVALIPRREGSIALAGAPVAVGTVAGSR
jgi:cytochrome c-type biogenesis protein CcmF